MRRFPFITCVAIFVLTWRAFGQIAEFEKRPVVEILFEPATQPLAPQDLQRVQMVHIGAPLRAEDVADSIDAMFATGRYRDIQVAAEMRGSGVAIRYVTKEARFVGHVRTTGKVSSPPDRTEIINVAQFQLGTPFRPDDLESARKNIETLLTNNGFYEAKVNLTTEEVPDAQQTEINIAVDPGHRARYDEPVIHGETKLSTSTIIKATGWRVRFIKRWRDVTQSLTSRGVEGVRKRYQRDDRLAAQVDLASLTYDPNTRRAKPELQIDAGPKIEIQAIETKVSKRVLKRYVPVYQEGVVDNDLLFEGARNLRDYFQSRGYPDVDVTYRQPPVSDDKQTIEYVISRGPKRKLVHVEIRGSKYFDSETLQERMFLRPSSFRFRNGRYSEAFQRRDEQTIENLYKANGFRNVRVRSSVENNYQGKEDHMAVFFDVTEGDQWRVAHLDIQGLQHFDKDSILGLLSSADGQPYSDVSVGADRAAIMTRYYSDGFRGVGFRVVIDPSEQPHEVQLRYIISEGPQNFVRDVLITGLQNTRLSHVRKAIGATPGGVLSMTAIRESERKLYDYGIFANIDSVVQNSDGDERYKYVLYDFDEAHRYNLSVGLGAAVARIGGAASNLSAPAGSTGLSPQLTLALNRLNMFGVGHTASFQGKISNLQQRASLSYSDPQWFGAEGRTITVTALYDLSRDVRTFASRRQEASVQLSQKLSRPSTILLRYAYRRVSTSDVVIPALLVPQLVQPVRIGIVTANYVQDRRDNPADPTRGMYNTVEVGLASKYFGSQRSFGRVLARNATYHRLGKSFVLARQTTVGVILPFNVAPDIQGPDSVPLPERFFGGGSISHRGFPENQAGPRDIGTPEGPGVAPTAPTGFPLGGDALFFNNVELRFPLLGENISGVLFHDAGNIYRSIGDLSFRFHQRSDTDFNYMEQAVGFGIRYKTPVGPVRLDLAYSINPPRFVGFKGSFQDLLTCNPNQVNTNSACQSVPQQISHFQFFFSIGQTF